MSDITLILSNMERDGAEASADLLPLVYEQLRKLAARELRNVPSGNTLQPTALVHEAYVRLIDQENEPKWNHRGHFYAAAATAMRRIVVESARRKKTIKRGGDRARVAIETNELAGRQRGPDMLALDEALTMLADDRPEIAQLVSLRYFAGLTMAQTAKAMGLSIRTAERHWTYAKAWLSEEVKAE